MTFFAIGQEEDDEEIANFRNWAVVQLHGYTHVPRCVIGPFGSLEVASDYLEDGVNHTIVEIIEPNPTILRLRARHKAEASLYERLAE